MRKLILAALAVLILSAAGGCRVFCDDYPSHRYRYAPAPVYVVAGTVLPAASPY